MPPQTNITKKRIPISIMPLTHIVAAGLAPRGVHFHRAVNLSADHVILSADHVILSAAKDLHLAQPEILRCAQGDRWRPPGHSLRHVNTGPSCLQSTPLGPAPVLSPAPVSHPKKICREIGEILPKLSRVAATVDLYSSNGTSPKENLSRNRRDSRQNLSHGPHRNVEVIPCGQPGAGPLR